MRVQNNNNYNNAYRKSSWVEILSFMFQERYKMCEVSISLYYCSAFVNNICLLNVINKTDQNNDQITNIKLLKYIAINLSKKPI